MLKEDRSLYDAALAATDLGWTIIPVSGKISTGRWKAYQTRRPTQEELLQWFIKDPRVSGLAVLYGHASGGLACRDFDTKQSYQAWKGKQPVLARTLPTVKTKRGFHVLFRVPPTLATYVALPDGEYRADAKHYSLLPPSVHPSGGLYRWAVGVKSPIPLLEDPTRVGLLGGSAGTVFLPPSPPRTPLILLGHPPGRPYSTPTCFQDNPLLTPLSMGQRWLLSVAAEKTASLYAPCRMGQRNNCLLGYTRALLRLSPHWGGLLDRAFYYWWRHAYRVVKTKSERYSHRHFYAMLAHCPPTSPTAYCDFDAEELPEALQQLPEKQRRLLQVCQCLQRWHGGDPFFLSYQDAARLLGVSQAGAEKLFHRLLKNRFLVRVAVGNNYQRRASSYRYLGG